MVYTIGSTNFTRRKKIPVTGSGSGSQTNFQIKLTALWAEAMQADYDDVRFTNADMQTLIDAWLESKTDSTTADIWVEFLTTPADGVEKTEAYMYFGNAVVASDWDGDATFESFDDFNRSNENPPVGWTIGDGGYEVLSNELHATDTFLNRAILDVSSGTTSSKILEFKGKVISTGATTDCLQILFGWTETDTGYVFGVAYHEISSKAFALYKRPDTWVAIATDTWANDQAWHDYKIIWTSSNVKAYRDNVLGINHNTPVATGHVGVRTWGDGGYYDNFRVRKYAANPPTYEFGSEEHQRRTPMMM